MHPGISQSICNYVTAYICRKKNTHPLAEDVWRQVEAEWDVRVQADWGW